MPCDTPAFWYIKKKIVSYFVQPMPQWKNVIALRKKLLRVLRKLKILWYTSFHIVYFRDSWGNALFTNVQGNV